MTRSIGDIHLRRLSRLRELNVGHTGLQSLNNFTNILGRCRGVSAGSGGAIRGRSGATRIAVKFVVLIGA